MHAQHPHKTQGVRRRDLLKAGLVAGMTLSARSLAGPSVSGCRSRAAQAAASCACAGGIRCIFDPQLTRNFKTNTTLSFVYSTLLRIKSGRERRRHLRRRAALGRRLGNAG